MCVGHNLHTCGHVSQISLPCAKLTSIKNKLKNAFSTKPEEQCTKLVQVTRTGVHCQDCQAEARDALRHAGQPWNVRVLRTPQKLAGTRNNNNNNNNNTQGDGSGSDSASGAAAGGAGPSTTN